MKLIYLMLLILPLGNVISEDNPIDVKNKNEASVELRRENIEQIDETIESHEEKVAKAPKHLPARVMLLARITEAEARGESYIGKVAVAEVVRNRAYGDNEFPDNISDVIFQENQFEPVRNGSITNTPSEDSFRAAEEALDGSNYAKGVLFFYNAKTAQSRWLDQLETVVVIGNHTFKHP